MNTAIIVAAGRGTRFRSGIPKQFLQLNGKPVIIRTLEAFEACDLIDDIAVVVDESQLEVLSAMLADASLKKVSKTVAGGEFRVLSVRNGFAAIDASSEIVAIHDGARPLVTQSEIRETILAAAEVGAACLVAAVTDTIKEVRGSRIVRTVDRSGLRRALTPQAFKYYVLQEAMAIGELNESVTDECYLVEKLGREIAVVEGDPANIKITHAEDLVLAEAILREVREN